jgi:hypothetical protein
METITKEIKAKYFALYYGLPVIRWNQWNNEVPNGRVTMNIPMQGGNFTVDEGWYLELTPLEQISDEDAIWFCKKNNFNYDNSLLDSKSSYNLEELRNDINHLMNDLDFPIKTHQYLQSKGYALSYLDYSVSDLVELNVIKLKK